jgi:hypothetical protein
VEGGKSVPTFRDNLSAPPSSVKQSNKAFILGYLTLQDGTDRLSRNVGLELPLFLDYLTLANGTDSLSRNVGTELPPYAA